MKYLAGLSNRSTTGKKRTKGYGMHKVAIFFLELDWEEIFDSQKALITVG